MCECVTELCACDAFVSMYVCPFANVSQFLCVLSFESDVHNRVQLTALLTHCARSTVLKTRVCSTGSPATKSLRSNLRGYLKCNAPPLPARTTASVKV